MQRRFARAYMKLCGINVDRLVKERVASFEVFGGNEVWVRRQFPVELHACRQRQSRAQTLLVVFLDADTFSPEQRRQQLNLELKKQELDELMPQDPVAILVPRRHIETWICSLCGEKVSEEDDCKKWDKPSKDAIRTAAESAFQRSRKNAKIGESCVPSFAAAVPELCKIG